MDSTINSKNIFLYEIYKWLLGYLVQKVTRLPKKSSNPKLQNCLDSNADACDSTSVGFTTSTITMYYTMMVRAHSKSLYIRPVLSYICKRRSKKHFFSRLVSQKQFQIWILTNKKAVLQLSAMMMRWGQVLVDLIVSKQIQRFWCSNN